MPTGWEQQREIDQGNGAGAWTPKQFTSWDYFANGSLHDVTVQNGAHTTLQSDTVSYVDTNNIYNDGNRVQDVLTLKGPDSTAPCVSTACTATYQYDPRDRVIHEDNGHGGVTDYKLDGAGNILTENQTGSTTNTRASQYLGNQLQQVTTTARINWRVSRSTSMTRWATCNASRRGVAAAPTATLRLAALPLRTCCLTTRTTI